MARALLDVKFLGMDIDGMIDEYLKVLKAPDKQASAKNAIINQGMKEAAKVVLPAVWSNMRRRTGGMQIFTDMHRIKSKGGGWRISHPTREQLAIFHPEVKDGEGFYPTAMEYGFKTKDGGRVDGDDHMLKAMEQNKEMALAKSGNWILSELDRLMQRHIAKKERAFKRRMRKINKVKRTVSRKYRKASKAVSKKVKQTKRLTVKKFKATNRTLKKKWKAKKKQWARKR